VKREVGVGVENRLVGEVVSKGKCMCKEGTR
jgi:hypothetical protein